MITTDQAKSLLNTLSFTRAYTGKPRKCCCGCSGTYRETEEAVERQKRKMLKLLQVPENHPDFGDTYVSVETPTRLYVLYHPYVYRKDRSAV